MKVTRLSLPKSGVDNYIVAGDWHTDHIHTPSLEILKKYALTLPKQRRALIINGDFIDAEFLMKKNEGYQKWIKRPEGMEEFFLKKSEEELIWANAMLDSLTKLFPRIIYIEGNHDWRYKLFANGPCPQAYRPNFNLTNQLSLKKRKITFIRYNNWLDIGHLSITHGMAHGSSALKKHYEYCGGRSAIFSHVHKYECKAFAARGVTRQVWSLPCMSTLNPEYVKNTDNNWTNGFGSIHMKPNGNFNVNIYQVWDNELVLSSGKILKGA